MAKVRRSFSAAICSGKRSTTCSIVRPSQSPTSNLAPGPVVLDLDAGGFRRVGGAAQVRAEHQVVSLPEKRGPERLDLRASEVTQRRIALTLPDARGVRNRLPVSNQADFECAHAAGATPRSLRGMITWSTMPYSLASRAERNLSRSVSWRTRSTSWPV